MSAVLPICVLSRRKGKGERAKDEGQRAFSFCGFILLLGRDAIPYLHLDGQGCVLWSPLTVREPERISFLYLKPGRFLP